jgi:hypothetical protein
MDAETKRAVKEAQAQLWEGQLWTRKDTTVGGDIWPESVIVVERASFIFGSVLTMAASPDGKRGHGFPIRADLLVDAYELAYDPVKKEGYLQARIDDYETALLAIMEKPNATVEQLQAMAKLAMKDYLRAQQAEGDIAAAIKLAEEAIQTTEPS